METIKNVMQLFVAKDQTANANEGSAATLTTVADGDLVVTDAKNVILDAASLPSGLSAFKLVANAGGTLVHSDIVEKGKVTNWKVTGTESEAQQVDYIGYNGTSGEIETLAANTIYTIRLYILGVTKADFMQQMIKEGFYKSGSSTPTQRAVALGLQKSLIANFSREPEQLISFERINSGAQLVDLDAAGTVTVSVVKGSDKIVFSGDVTASLTAGSVIRIGGTGAGTTPTYVVTGHDSGAGAARIYTLDNAWQGATNSAVAISETVTEGDWGLKLTGLDLDFVVGKFKSAVVSWDTQIDFDSTVTKSVKAYPGIGTYQQIASIEKELQADEYVFRSFVEGAPVDRAQASSGDAYDIGILEYDGVIKSGGGTLDVHSPKQIMIAFENNTAQGDDTNVGVATTIDAILTAWGTTYNEDANLTA